MERPKRQDSECRLSSPLVRCFLGPVSGLVWVFTFLGLTSLPFQFVCSQQAKKDQPPDNSVELGNVDLANTETVHRQGYLVQVPIPINGTVVERVNTSIQRVLEKELNATGDSRPILVLEFDNRNGTNGIGSEFEDCLKLARLLTSPEMNKLRTVAYLPGLSSQPKDLFQEAQQDVAVFQSHVVLVALSCEEIVMHKDAAIGNAGIELPVVDELYATAYQVMSEKRRVFPSLVALSMLKKNLVVYRVELKPDGVKYVEEAEYQDLVQKGRVVNTSTISGIDNFGFFSSADLQAYRLIRHRVGSRSELADRYNLNPTALEGDPSLGEKWNAIRISVKGVITERMVSWIENALGSRFDEEATNLVIIELESAGGEPQAVVRLANRLSEFDPLKTRTVAYVSKRAGGLASIVAMGCDHLVMHPDAVLGGGKRLDLDGDKLLPIKASLRELAKRKETNWSFAYGLLDNAFEVRRYKNARTGRMRLMSEEEKEELKDASQWQDLQLIDLAGGVDGKTVESLGLVRSLVEDFSELKSFYQMAEDPALLEPTLADKWVENFARYLASPRITWLVLFGAIFFLSTEFSNPGLGVPGFLSAICWMLFFWSQYFDGNASVLEILLFVVGVVFVLIEFFVLPGFGVFGIGGAIMVTVSIILAVQTFVIPSSEEEVSQLTTSLSTFVAASSGMFIAFFIFRKYIDKIPVFRRLMLTPKVKGDGFLQDAKESLVQYAELKGKSGVTQTRLMPSGKAIIGNELYNVISDGRMIEKGSVIIVREVSGNKIEVAIAES
ncbi:MAG: NfeD family protein [Planctomycetota bacterium]|nr:NfeD family protein [Planctomycetota bacterium]